LRQSYNIKNAWCWNTKQVCTAALKGQFTNQQKMTILIAGKALEMVIFFGEKTVQLRAKKQTKYR